MSADNVVGRKSLKRRRSSMDEEDSSETEVAEHSRAWNDPSLLEEMGLGVLSEDSPFFEEVVTATSEGSSEQEVFPISSSDDDCTENVEVVKGVEVKPSLKKRKLSEPSREPFKQQQFLVTNVVANDSDELIKRSPHRKKDSGETRGEMKAPKCDTSKTKVSIRSSKKDSKINNNNNSRTENICNNDFKLTPVRQPKDTSTGKNYFSLLPDELILGIFRNLDRASVVHCREVSKQFLRVANDESLWTRVDLGGRTIPPGAIGEMMLRGCFIVRLASACIADPVIIPKLLPDNFTSNIQYLDLSMATISPQGLASFLGYCTKLRKLSLENCTLSDQVCSAISKNRGLEVLNLTMCSGITPEGLQKLLTECKLLQSLNLGWTILSPQAIDLFARNVPSSVERLNISGCRHKLTDQHVIDILKRCVNLLELDISDCIDLTEKVITYIVKEISGLEYLAISRCYSIPLDCLKSLQKVDSLTYLDLFGLCSEADLKNLRGVLDDKSLNQFHFSSVARPTVGLRRTSIWGLRVRD